MSVKVRNLILGEGKVKICVPIMGRDFSELSKEIKALDGLYFDMIEWRADYYGDLSHVSKDVFEVRQLLKDTPLLVTLRTKNEGGLKQVTKEEYSSFYETLLKTDMVDCIDVEAFFDSEIDQKIIACAHKYHVSVILSYHDFHATPDREEILDRLKQMDAMNGDICKIACMPNRVEDVLTLLYVTEEASKQIKKPLITMSMGKLGVVSRIAGETFGSCLSFGCAMKASAPGQINANDLHQIIDVLHCE